MYALIHDSQLILGPIQWNYRLINSELEDLEIDYKVSPRSYENVPIAADVDTKTYILPAVLSIPDYDARFQGVGNFDWIIVEENNIPVRVEFNYSIGDKTLDQIKVEYKSQVAPIRREKENTQITLTINNTEVTVSTSREQRISFVSKLSSAPGPYLFKFNDNLWLDITSTDLQNIINQIDIKVQEAFDWEYQKIQEIDACTTGEEVYNVVLNESPVIENNPNAIPTNN